MKITVTGSETEFNRLIAWRIIGQILAKPHSVIGLATGETTKGIHREIARIHHESPFDTSSVSFYGLDEMVMVPEDFPGTCTRTIQTDLTDPLGLPPERLIMPPVQSDDYQRESERFAQRIMEAGGSDLQIVGIGYDGHIGMNLPGTPFEQESWFPPLSGELDARIRGKNHYPDDAPLAGITLGIRTIMRMPRLILAAKSKGKAEIIKQAVAGPITQAVPASVLQLHPNCELILDADAASFL